MSKLPMDWKPPMAADGHIDLLALLRDIDTSVHGEEMLRVALDHAWNEGCQEGIDGAPDNPEIRILGRGPYDLASSEMRRRMRP